VLGTPPAFILSQDQTLHFNWIVQSEDRTQLTELGSTGRHYLVFKDQKTRPDFFYLAL
jgi:hypothetical protein